MNDRVKKLLMSVAALGALAAGGAAYASAQGSPPAPSPSTSAPATTSEPASAADPADANDAPDAAGEKDGGEANDQVSGDAAAKATAAALSAVPGGKVGDISAEQPDAKQGNDTQDAGDTPDPAYESKIAYDVEVTKADGSAVSVHLDKAFAVLGTAKEDAHD